MNTLDKKYEILETEDGIKTIVKYELTVADEKPINDFDISYEELKENIETITNQINELEDKLTDLQDIKNAFDIYKLKQDEKELLKDNTEE